MAGASQAATSDGTFAVSGAGTAGIPSSTGRLAGAFLASQLLSHPQLSGQQHEVPTCPTSAA